MRYEIYTIYAEDTTQLNLLIYGSCEAGLNTEDTLLKALTFNFSFFISK